MLGSEAGGGGIAELSAGAGWLIELPDIDPPDIEPPPVVGCVAIEPASGAPAGPDVVESDVGPLGMVPDCDDPPAFCARAEAPLSSESARAAEMRRFIRSSPYAAPVPSSARV